jgi:hypothetical protein
LLLNRNTTVKNQSIVKQPTAAITTAIATTTTTTANTRGSTNNSIRMMLPMDIGLHYTNFITNTNIIDKNKKFEEGNSFTTNTGKQPFTLLYDMPSSLNNGDF